MNLTSSLDKSFLSFDNNDFAATAGGSLIMSKEADDMNVKAGVYRYDLQTTETATGDVSTWLGGLFQVQGDVTE